MTTPRSLQVHPDATPYYHCMSRCVRQAFLLGEDTATGRRFDHRKQWVVDELAALEQLFAVDVCAYAVMSNHIHLVLRLGTEAHARWSDDEVVRRARGLFPYAVRLAEEARVLGARIGEYRERLGSLSWFMRCLNERIARRANLEDGCHGRFWEGRFKCRPLLDVGALLSCMVYVDLNPVHAGLADSLSESDYTSIQARLMSVGRALQAQRIPSEDVDVDVHGARAPRSGPSPQLVSFVKDPAPSGGGHSNPIPFELAAYVDLVRHTGQAHRPDKRGRLSDRAAVLLERSGLRSDHWNDALVEMSSLRFAALGERHLIEIEARRCGRQRASNAAWVRRAYRVRSTDGSGSMAEQHEYGCAA